MKTDDILGEQIDEPPCHVITAHLTGAHFHSSGSMADGRVKFVPPLQPS